MSSRSGKVIGWMSVSLLVFAYIHHDYAKQQAQGYDAFIAQQTYRFQHYIATSSWVETLLGSLFTSWLVLGIYELIQYGLKRLSSKAS